MTYYNGTSFTWNYGRKLVSATTADGTSISYLYNDSGIRTRKTVNGTATDYFLDGSTIVAEKTGNNTTWYYYDGDGTREAIEYKGNVYYYFYNAQGDVMGLYDNNLNVVVNYTYDSWGNTVSITGSLADTLGKDNPFRYRGYYFDSDTGLYYLNSRYYDSNTGRFINVDGFVQTGQGVLDKNMFAYCMNNPVNRIDLDGNVSILLIGLGVLGLAAATGAIGYNLVKASQTTPIDDAGTAFNIVRNHEEIKQNNIDAQYNYTKDAVCVGTGQNNYKPNPPRNFSNVGNGQKRNQMSQEKYIELCKQNYNNMLMYCSDTIQRGDTWEDLVKSGKDVELCGQMVTWDESAYSDFNLDHTAKHTYKGIKEAYFPFD